MENEEKQDALYEQAEQQVKFKRHALIYGLVISGLWLIYLFDEDKAYMNVPWPIYPTFGWGIGLLSHFLGVYNVISLPGFSVEREYEQLRKRQSEQPSV
jgi:hypothetical protein